jgi:hypothetical protein
MTCKHCGTEIADKALVCYRCGQATFEPVVKPGQAPKRRSSLPLVLALLVLVLGALYMGQAAAGQAPRLVSWVVAGLAAIVLAWRFWRRRR